MHPDPPRVKLDRKGILMSHFHFSCQNYCIKFSDYNNVMDGFDINLNKTLGDRLTILNTKKNSKMPLGPYS